MLTIIFGITTLVFGVGWLFSRITIETLLIFWQEKHYPPPTAEEIKVYTRKAVEQIFTFGKK